MKIRFICILFLPLMLLMSSCLSMGLNFHNRTPKKASRLPKFSVKDSLIGFNSPYRSCFDVKHYDIHVSIHTADKSIKGFVTTHFELLNSSNKIQLDLDAQLYIDSVRQEGKPLSFTRKFSAVFVDLSSQDKQQSLTVYYHGKPLVAKKPPWDGGFVWKRDKNKKLFVSVACEGTGAKEWLPIKTYLGDEPDSVSMHLTVPKGLVGISNGNLVDVQEKEDRKIYHWKTSYPVNPYNITFYMGDYKLIEESYSCIDGEKMKLSYYVLPESFEKAKVHFTQTAGILKAYEELFGKYPWPKDNYKLVESPFEGMEHQTAIAYGNGYKNERYQSFDYIILHESAHEWWGNAVSVADFSDIWIHEGIATYAEALYVERTKGYKAYLDYIHWTEILVMNKKPVVGPTGLYYWSYNDEDPYNKGAVMLHTLRNHLQNDSLFFSILKTFFKNNCYKTTDTKTFIDLVNQMSGKDLTYFFSQYLYKRSSPHLLWNFYYDFDLEKAQLIYQLGRVSPDFTMTIEVEQEGDKFYIHPTPEIQFFTPPHGNSDIRMNTNYSYLQDAYKALKPVKKK